MFNKHNTKQVEEVENNDFWIMWKLFKALLLEVDTVKNIAYNNLLKCEIICLNRKSKLQAADGFLPFNLAINTVGNLFCKKDLLRTECTKIRVLH